MLRIWLKFLRWLTSIARALATKTPVKWSEKINELTALGNEAIDKLKPAKPGKSKPSLRANPPPTQNSPLTTKLRRGLRPRKNR